MRRLIQLPVISALEYVTLAVESRAMGGFAFCAVDSGAIDVREVRERASDRLSCAASLVLGLRLL